MKRFHPPKSTQKLTLPGVSISCVPWSAQWFLPLTPNITAAFCNVGGQWEEPISTMGETKARHS